MQQNSFVVYNASAGSGKTFTLVKSYLETLFSSYNKDKFKHVLAITFTNKAVAEMKDRILKNLKAFANERILTHQEEFKEEYQMFTDICENLGFTEIQLHEKAIVVQDAILNNYAAFDIVTIDTFTHRIIRTFAYDLKLSQNFEVALDTKEVLQEAVNNVVAKVGEDEMLTQLLIDFAMQKADDDKSWDIALDLFKISDILLKEDEIQHVDLLKNKTFKDFKTLQKIVVKKIKNATEEAIEIAKNRLAIFEKNGIEKTDFPRGSLYNYFLKFAKGDIFDTYATKWQVTLIEGGVISKKGVASATIIEQMQSKIIADFEQTKALHYELNFLNNFQKNSVPLSLINEIQKELKLLKEDQNILLISEFNSIIANEIKGQPAPFIYERIGERYQNYFIDEFQDTSQLQWQNLIPLTENTLVTEAKKGEKNSLMIVGDAKQAIYRWRGGKAEQFIELYEKENPFYIEKQIENLETNWRSYSEVVNFNNHFFTHLSQLFTNKTHQNLYEIGNKQKDSGKNGGYVAISFVANETVAIASELYQEKVYEIIEKVQENGFKLADVCVITRTRKDGVAIADYLTDKNLAIVSSETLLINKSKEVQFIISFLEYVLHPNHKMAKIEMLFFLYQKLKITTSENQFYMELLALSQEDFFTALATQYHIQFDFTLAKTLPFYELVEYVVRAFALVNESDAYIQYFLDEVLSFSQRKSTGVTGFLEHWELKKDKLSIVAPEGNDAVTLMTIHKSKGLEFPIVIFPFADDYIYKQIEPKVWFSIDKEIYGGFQEAYLNYNKNIAHYNENGSLLYQKQQSELELDTVNLLYVALTRAKEQLYIVSKLEIDKKTGEENLKKYSGFFINYLKSIGKWQEETVDYAFGEIKKQSEETKILKTKALPFISSARIDHNLAVLTKSGYLWDTAQQEAIERGNLIHLILSKIKYQRDVDMAFYELRENGILSIQQEEELLPIVKELVMHSEISTYFNEAYTIYNERVILDVNGNQLIPDRVVVKNNKAIIIDYKTGEMNPKYHQQLFKYASALQEMGFEVTKKILVYLDKEITIEEVK